MSAIIYWRSKVNKFSFWFHPEGCHTKGFDWAEGSALSPAWVARESCYEDYCLWCGDKKIDPYDQDKFFQVSTYIIYPHGDRKGRFRNSKVTVQEHVMGQGYVDRRVHRAFIKVPTEEEIKTGVLEMTGFLQT